MTDQETAADHLKIIRSLMERATVYRAISAPAALFGGIVALVTGIVMASKQWGLEHSIKDPEVLSPERFYLIWVGVLAVAGTFNAVLLWHGSKRRGESFYSSGMKLAMRATVPPMLAGGLVSIILLKAGVSRADCALLWVVFYSLALLAAGSFAPRSMRWLGWMFFCAGLALFSLRFAFAETLKDTNFSADLIQAGLIMAMTFGALHILYAMIILFRRPKGEEV